MSNTKPSEPLDGEDLINIGDVTERIEYLEAHDCHNPERSDTDFPCSNGFECATCDETTGSELEDLRTLASIMEPFGDRASAIRDSYLEKFVQNEADDITGVGQDSYLFSYVKWDELAGDRAAEMEETTFRGSTYFATA